MSLAIFRITKVDGKETSTAQDPFIQVGYFSSGKTGTPQYGNQPVHIIAAPRRSGYPGTRWVVLTASRLQIGAVLHTESYDLLIDKGQLSDFSTFGPASLQVFRVRLNVQAAASVKGGGMWSALQQAQVTREAEEEGITDDLLKLRGRKVARRLAGWAWDKFWD